MKRKNKNLIKDIGLFLLTFGVVGGLTTAIATIDLEKDNSNSQSNSLVDKIERNYHFTLVGSFNEWNLEDNTYLLDKEDENIYSIELTTKEENTEFKIVHNNSWAMQYATVNVKNGIDLIDVDKENITLLDISSYYIQVNSLLHEVNIVKLDTSLMDVHLSPFTSTWGENGSVECLASNVIKEDKYYKASISKENQTSAYLISKYYYGKGQFDIWANCNIFDYGTFAFWLTGVENDLDNSYQEITIELLKENQMICSTGSNVNNYTQNKLEVDFDFNDWHKYSINVLEDKVEFKVDDVVILTVTENIPTCEYFKVNIGLLYPKTGWTGNIDETEYNICDVKFTNLSGTSI